MKPDFLKALAASPVAKLNQHLLSPSEKPNNSKKIKQPKSSKALRWIGTNLHFWCIDKKLTLSKEYEFAPGRKYAADWAIEELKILIEYEGIFSEKSRHTTVTGYSTDSDKYRLAAKLGFTVFRYTALNYEKLIQDLEEMIK